MKRCSKCKETKSLDLFYKNSHRRDGHSSYCRDCHNQWYMKSRNSYNPGRRASRYGLGAMDIEMMYIDQGGRCKICYNPTPLTGKGAMHVDHCHTTGKVRGLLCFSCNWLLGKANDDPQVLRSAIDYLENS